MAGYGNRTNPDLDHNDLVEQHSNTRFGVDHSNAYSGGHETYGSGTTGGAGFGNKTMPSDSTVDNSEFRFGNRDDTQPYSGHAGRHGSGSTGGAGFGNKTGSFGESKDSTMGKVMEKIGTVTHNEKMVEKGRAKREAQGLGQPIHGAAADEDAYAAN
ncbi:hypothetical protein P154DRAFT_537408 [Amniculicola lignicola CBS 123094]|uniref:Uncharacterized protein n=1 Tax=Amniculicola lignicola CBS 123094 TaxID=1392246 RepID=A0A6A5W5E5_9PLEO|nr:hypothetical protein P154DRAFT_537408 [Amniculicola lignicola CBS 123094]